MSHNDGPRSDDEYSPTKEQYRNPKYTTINEDIASITPQKGDERQWQRTKHYNHTSEYDGIKVTDWVQAGSAVVTALVTGGLLFLGVAQLRTFRAQAEIMRIQSIIMGETREIAKTALDRPLVYLDFISHSLPEWRTGKSPLLFKIRFINHGSRPAILRTIFAHTFFSNGRGKQKYENIIGIERVVEPDGFRFQAELGDCRIDVLNADGERIFAWENGIPLTIPPKGTTEIFSVTMIDFPYFGEPCHPDLTRLRELTSINISQGIMPKIFPWLMGIIKYEDDIMYQTNFCLRGEIDGSARQEYGPPYNERT